MKYSIQTDLHKNNNKSIYESLKDKLSNWEEDNVNFEYLFIIGGDGSFLKSVNPLLMNPNIKVVLINSGNLGFYSYTESVDHFELDEVLNDQNYVNLDVLEVSYNGDKYFSINDFSYYSNYTSEIKTYINDVLLQSIHGNGMLVATPFGSTARNKSLGGAIIMPNSKSLSIIEIEAINNRTYKSLNSPVVVNNNSIIKFETSNYRDAFLLFDGRELKVSEDTSIIEIRNTISKLKVLIRTDDHNWINKLNYAFK
ncbi:MAG: NAD(+)/NADH kinase [Mycoplasma sp.]